MEVETIKCMHMDCRKVIEKGEIYYLLGGGTVINCEYCACEREYTLIVGEKYVTFKRGWDKTAVSGKLKKTVT